MEDHVRTVSDWMKRLNRDAAEMARQAQVRAVTDVTGYGLMGHLSEMLPGEGLGVEIAWETLPYHPGARTYAEAYTFPGGAMANQKYFRNRIDLPPSLTDWEELLLFAPETSGGLLLAVPRENEADLLGSAEDRGVTLWTIGTFTDGEGITVR